VGPANFEWIVEQVADMAINKAKTAPGVPELRWSALLAGGETPGKPMKKTAAAAGAKTKRGKSANGAEAAAAQPQTMGSVAAAVHRAKVPARA
jgi:hypothetical protein